MEKELLKMAFNAGYDCSLMHNNGEHQGYYDFDEFYKCEIASLNSSVSDFFSFAKYLEENFKYYDNTDSGDVYKNNNDQGLYSENDIYHEWSSKRT